MDELNSKLERLNIGQLEAAAGRVGVKMEAMINGRKGLEKATSLSTVAHVREEQ